MKKSLLFALLGVAVLIMATGVIAVALKKPVVAATPSALQTSEVAKTETPIEPTTSSTSDESEDDEVDMSNYEEHKLPSDSDTWTDQEWEWWSTAAVNFDHDYVIVFTDHFGEDPSSEIIEVAQNFAEEVCTLLDDDGTIDDVAEGVVDSGGSKQTQMALAMAVHPGVYNFCPWNIEKLD